MKNSRMITIYFKDGSDLKFEFPIQPESSQNLATAIRKSLNESHLILEVENAM
jgi:hypothetical protein